MQTTPSNDRRMPQDTFPVLTYVCLIVYAFLFRVPVSILVIALPMISHNVISWHQVDARLVLGTRLLLEKLFEIRF